MKDFRRTEFERTVRTMTTTIRYPMARVEIAISDAEIFQLLARMYDVPIEDVIHSTVGPALKKAQHCQKIWVNLGHAIRAFLGLPSMELTEAEERAYYGLPLEQVPQESAA